jgi:hypothetical protein
VGSQACRQYFELASTTRTQCFVLG